MPNPILDAAIVGPGRWGQRLVDAVSVPASAKLRFTHAVARTPDRVRAYCSARGLLLSDDLARVLAGPIVAIRCESQRRVLDVDLDDTTSAFARFASGATGCISTLTATRRIVRLQVFGTRGWLHLLDHRILEICDIDGKVRRIEYPHVDIERAELEAFADAVAGVEQYPVPVEEAVHGVAVMEAAIRSARSEGQRVAVEAAAV